MIANKYLELPPNKIRPNPDNVRTHPRKQIVELASTIDRIGFITPIIVDDRRCILAGHARWAAAQHLRLPSVPVIVVSGLSEGKRRLFAIADNKFSERAGWDSSALTTELSELTQLLADEGLDISLTGFETPEIDRLMTDYLDPEHDVTNEIPQISSQPVSRLGDLFKLGDHRLLCGDATKESALHKLMGRERASMIFADPPYNLRISSIQGRGKIRHREFVRGSGELSTSEYEHLLSESLSLAAKFSRSGSLHYVAIDWRHLREMLAAGDKAYTELVNVVVWGKTNSGMGSLYRSQHEFIFVFRNGSASHLNNVQLGRHGRNRSNLWTYPGVNTFRAGRLDELSIHPTVKPVALVADAMRDCTRRRDIVLDSFLGSGTTILAAERIGRRGYGLEVDPLYVDAAIRRWEKFTKTDGVLVATGQTFGELVEARLRGAQRAR